MKRCNKCGVENLLNARFCMNCAYTYLKTCPICRCMLMCCAKFCSNCGNKQNNTNENVTKSQNTVNINNQNPEVTISLGILNEQLPTNKNKYNFENLSSLDDIYKVISHNFGKTDFSRLYSHHETKNNMINFIKDHIKGKISMREFFFITL